ncbi:phage antirepressor KilAC domain-containing protein [Flavobacterium sp.]|uniref:phage antirepressor KilAC domain-containing protein n=1 Tax=Flavobacterium sp. TaxID=239 RepID=UPI003752A047
MGELINTNHKEITSLELVKQINLFREKEGNRSELRHDTLLGIIRDEFEEEISLQKLLESNYKSQRGQTYPMFTLTISQAKQVLIRESKFVRKAIISYLEILEEKLKATPAPIQLPQNYIGALKALLVSEEEKEKLQKQVNNQQAKIEFIDRVIISEDTVDIGQCSKILELNFGRNTLFKELRERGVFFKNRNEPKQNFVERGYFKLKEQFIETHNHGTKTIIKVLVTQRGLGYLSTLFKANPAPIKPALLV